MTEIEQEFSDQDESIKLQLREHELDMKFNQSITQGGGESNDLQSSLVFNDEEFEQESLEGTNFELKDEKGVKELAKHFRNYSSSPAEKDYSK